jgi:hypothetical protein
MGDGNFGVQPQISQSFTGGSFTPSGRRISAGGNYTSLSLSLEFYYGLTDNLWASLFIPYLHNWASEVDNPGPQRQHAANFGGLGDTTLTWRYLLLEATATRPTVTGLFAVKFPFGHHRPLNPGNLGTDDLGNGAYRFSWGLNTSKCARPFIFYTNLWYSVATTSKNDVPVKGLGTIVKKVHPRDRITVNLAMEYPLGWKGPWVALLEFYSYWELGPIFKPQANTKPVNLFGTLLGLEYIYSDKLEFALGVSIDLAGKNTDYNYTPIFSAYYLF